MKTITLKEAHQILENATAVIVDDMALVYPSISDLEDKDDNEFLFLSWDDEDGETNALYFYERDNKEVKVSHSSMFLYADGEEDHKEITILNQTQIE